MKLIIWLIVSTPLWAAQSLPVEDLRTALKKYQDMESLNVDFKQTKTLKDMDFKVESEGHMAVQMPDLVRWEMTKPSSIKVVLNRDTITIENSTGKNSIQAESIPAAQRTEFLNMFSWLKLDADAIAKNYDVTRFGPNQYNFSARAPGALFTGLVMNLDKEGHVKDMRFLEKSGDNMFLRFSKPKVKYNKKK